MTHYKKHSIYKGRRAIFAFISIILVCMLLQGNVRAAEMLEGEPVGAEATATDAVNVEAPGKYDEKKGIASIRLMYCADSGAKDVIKTGYAFFIGDDESTYLISCCDTVILNEEEKNAVAAAHGVTPDKVNTVIELVLKNDVIVELSIVNSSEGLNFAILQPSTKIASCMGIRLCDDSTKTKKGQVVHAYDADMQQIDCTIEDWSEINDAHYYRYTASQPITRGFPLLNEEGEAIGIVSTINKGNPEETYALQIDEVIDVLTVLGIQYNPEIVVDTSKLEEVIAAYEELDADKYAPESWKVCEDAYNQASELYHKVQAQEVDNYTQDAVDAATATLQDSIDNLKKAELPVKTVIIIATIACGVLFIAVVTLAILLAVQCKRCKKLSEEQGNQAVLAKEALKISGRITPGFVTNHENLPLNRSLQEAGQSSLEEIGETSVLGIDMDEHGQPFNDTAVRYPTIVRYKTGETFVVNQNSYIIGSAADSVDYCITRSHSISRKHACIMKFEDGYYIQDLDTTNGTYVNDIRVMPGRYMKLDPGNIIRLAEEEFEYKG